MAMAFEAQADDVDAAEARTTEAKATAVEENAAEVKAAQTKFSGTKAAVEGGNARKARRSSRGESRRGGFANAWADLADSPVPAGRSGIAGGDFDSSESLGAAGGGPPGKPGRAGQSW